MLIFILVNHQRRYLLESTIFDKSSRTFLDFTTLPKNFIKMLKMGILSIFRVALFKNIIFQGLQWLPVEQMNPMVPVLVLHQVQLPVQSQVLHLHLKQQVLLIRLKNFGWSFFLDCGKTNKLTFLKKLKVAKKVKNSLDCQKLCASYSGCTHFMWKNNRKVARRTCTLQNIGYKTKKNFVSGPVNCWIDKLLTYWKRTLANYCWYH